MHSDRADTVSAVFSRTPFVAHLGIMLAASAPGRVEASMRVRPEMRQHTGLVHAGVVATIADHCAGGAAATLIEPGQTVLTAEFKINLLRPGEGDELWCEAKVLKPGRRVIVSESEVYAVTQDVRILIAKMTATLVVVPDTPPAPDGTGGQA